MSRNAKGHWRAGALIAALALVASVRDSAAAPCPEGTEVRASTKRCEEGGTLRLSPSSPVRATTTPSAAAQSFSTSGVQIEAFGRIGGGLISAAGEDTFEVVFGDQRDSSSISNSATRTEPAWGGGIRLLRGGWGVEGSWQSISSVALSPSWATLGSSSDAGEPGTDEYGEDLVPIDLSFSSTRADLYAAQVVRVFGRGTEGFIGIGAGWIRAETNPQAFLPLGADEVSGVGAPIPELATDIRVAEDRSSVVFVGSVGATFRLGRLLLRPRGDVIVSPALTSESQAGVAAAGFTLTHRASVRPTIFLLSLDIGLAN